MIVSSTDIPRNSETPLTAADLAELTYELAAINAAALLAKAASQCGAPPSSMPSPGLQQDALQAIQVKAQGLINQSANLGAAVVQSQTGGAVVADDDVSAAPVVIPFIDVPSAQPNTVRSFPRGKRHVRQPGVPWGTSVASDGTGACGVPGTVLERVRANPFGMLLLAVGAGAVIYAAAKK
jgi:hypothetical protein